MKFTDLTLLEENKTMPSTRGLFGQPLKLIMTQELIANGGKLRMTVGGRGPRTLIQKMVLSLGGVAPLAKGGINQPLGGQATLAGAGPQSPGHQGAKAALGIRLEGRTPPFTMNETGGTLIIISITVNASKVMAGLAPGPLGRDR